MPAEEKNRTKPEQNKLKRVVDPLHAMIVSCGPRGAGICHDCLVTNQ